MTVLGQFDLTSALWELEQTFSGLTTRNPLKEVRAPMSVTKGRKRKTNTNTNTNTKRR